ncbi:MAG: dynamin family protein [Pseudomonadota bacterium]
MSEHSSESVKPRVALMGEFSAGKSTLINMLLSRAPLPVQITATSVPPIWLSFGKDAAVCVNSDGEETPIDLSSINEILLEETQYVRVWLESDLLEICDLIDMPGISDPNMSTETWKSVFDKVDHVVWCTHATQAWRQSEAASWEEMKEHTTGENILAVTQIDKITTSRDRTRLMSRLEKEAGAMFACVFPIAALEANEAKNEQVWHSSGAADFATFLVELTLKTRSKLENEVKSKVNPEIQSKEAASDAEQRQLNESKIVPRRVPGSRSKRKSATPRNLQHDEKNRGVTDMSNAG